MTEPLRIYLIDDNPDDRALVHRALRRSFPSLAVQHITDSASFHEALVGTEPHLAITDFQLRWTDGLAVLNQLKNRWPNCPVIMFTGTGSEEVAVQAMKAGLDDYVLKSPKHYARVPGVAKNVLELTRRRREIRAAEQRYSTLFNSVPVGLYRVTPSGIICDANPALIEMLGFPDRASLLAVNTAELYLDPEQHRRWRQLMETDGVVRNFEAKLRSYDGKTCWTKDSARAVQESESSPLFYEGLLEDITDRKAAEEEREKLIFELQDALAKIKTLSGLLPICASCKRIRDDRGYWNQIEVYIESHSDAEFTHSFCPECVKRLYPEVLEEFSRVATTPDRDDPKT